MADPIYHTTDNNTIDHPKQSFPSVDTHVIDRSGVNGMDPTYKVVDNVPEKAAPKNPPSEWSSGPDNNVYLQGE